MQVDYISVLKVYGPWGIAFGILVVFAKGLLMYIKKQSEDSTKVLVEQIGDARKERDRERDMRREEIDKFLESLKLRDAKMERGFDEIVRALRDTHK